jgi:hypothetical protein
MIKKLPILLISLQIVFFAACKKDHDNSFDCEITGVSNINAKVGDNKVVHVSIENTQGVPENVELSLQNVPRGISYYFETSKGTPNFTTVLTISMNNEVKLGKHTMTLEAKSKNLLKSVDFEVDINDSICMTMKVYDATKWSYDAPAGELSDSAIIKLYKDSLSFVKKLPFYTTSTDKNGLANFYHLAPGTYLFTAEKGNSSNIVSRKSISGIFVGFATTNIDKYGQLQYRDQNGDGKITDLDRVLYDMVITYESFFSERVVWIGN